MSATERVQVGIRELRQHASRYIEMAERGITIDVARRGNVVAHLVPHGPRRTDPLEALYARGLLRPAEEPGSVLDVAPVTASSGTSATEALLQMRDEERF